MHMDILDAVQKSYPSINKAAGEFLFKLSGTGITRDLALSAELAGLMLEQKNTEDAADDVDRVGTNRP